MLAFALWFAWKLWHKYRFRRSSRLPHITIDELLAALAGDRPPLLLDLRGAVMLAQTGPIPNAIATDHDRLHEAVADWPRDRPIVTLCACPEDADAIQAAGHRHRWIEPAVTGGRRKPILALPHRTNRGSGLKRRVALIATANADQKSGRRFIVDCSIALVTHWWQ